MKEKEKNDINNIELKKLLLKINNTPDIDDANKRQYIYLSGFFEENIFYELSPTISPSIPTNQVVGWMPLEDMDTIVIDHTRGSLRGFINCYSYGAYIRFKFTIDGQDYRCISCEDFLLDYGRLKGYLLDDNKYTFTIDENNINPIVNLYEKVKINEVLWKKKNIQVGSIGLQMTRN